MSRRSLEFDLGCERLICLPSRRLHDDKHNTVGALAEAGDFESARKVLDEDK